MNQDNFEDRIKSAFERHRPEADTDAIWENIEPHLKKKKKRRFVIFWMLGLGLLLLLFRYCGWGDASSLSGESLALKNAPAPSSEDAGRSKEHAVAPAGGKNRHAASGDLAEAARDRVFPETPRAANPPVAVLFPAGQQRSENETHIEKPIENDRKSEMDGKAGGNSGEQPSGDHNNASAPVNAQPDIPRNGAADLRANDAQVSDKDGYRPDKPLREPSAADDGTGSKENHPAPSVSSDDKRADKNKQDGDSKKDKNKKKKKHKSRWEHSIGIQAGPACAFQQLQENSGTVVPPGLLDGRKATEHSMESFTAGLFYSAAHRKGFMLKTGLNYRQINEKFELAYEKKETEQINGVISVIVDDAGNVIGQTMGPKTITKTVIYSNVAYNHYRFLNLPVGAGYRNIAKKSSWEIAGGMDVNLFFRFEGTVYNTDNIPVHIESGTTTYESMFRRTTGWGVWLSGAYDRRLKGPLRWQVSAGAQLPLRPLTQPDYPLTQRYFNVGVQLGLVYQIEEAKKKK